MRWRNAETLSDIKGAEIVCKNHFSVGNHFSDKRVPYFKGTPEVRKGEL